MSPFEFRDFVALQAEFNGLKAKFTDELEAVLRARSPKNTIPAEQLDEHLKVLRQLSGEMDRISGLLDQMTPRDQPPETQ